MKRFQLVSTNKTFFKPYTIMLSTVQLPISSYADIPKFETCLFVGDHSDVLETYDTLYEATVGHVKYTERLNLK